ncbi:hypothetical protein [Aquimarina agarilytica]|uniref:hypothetical protein n=1 Tax=Aquimarina agarilytica TaxID=1087449 RepID=UPI0002891E13|nr:hypothetical protein [Aquimarina agarilytica]
MTMTQAQNKIDYIVFHKPKEAGKLLYNYGFEVPKDKVSLVKSIKALIRKEGRKVTEQLLSLHPDTKAILSLKETNTSHCRACNQKTLNASGTSCKSCGHSGYKGAGDEDHFLGQFDTYSDKELETYYRKVTQNSEDDPENKTLAQEVQLIWNELRLRKQENKTQEKNMNTKESKGISKDDLILFGMVFIAGILVGHGLKISTIHGK